MRSKRRCSFHGLPWLAVALVAACDGSPLASAPGVARVTLVPGAAATSHPTAVDAGGVASDECRVFGGKVHGVTKCLRLEKGVLRSADRRVPPGGSSIAARCGEVLRLPRTPLAIRCEPAGSGSMRILADTMVDGGKPSTYELDRAQGSFDFVVVWGLDRGKDVLLTVDVGVAE